MYPKMGCLPKDNHHHSLLGKQAKQTPPSPFSVLSSYVRCFKCLLWFLLSGLFLLSYALHNRETLFHRLVPSPVWLTTQSPPQAYLINTPTCRLAEWPLFDAETRSLFTSHYNEDFPCTQNSPLLSIRRLNFTWIHIHYPPDTNWTCQATELARNPLNDGLTYGPVIGSLGPFTNLANNLTATQIKLSLALGLFHRWDSTEYPPKDDTKQDDNQPKMSVILLGIDSVSRANFERHMKQTKGFFDRQGFIPLLGYHKVGENSFPNIMPMFTGQLSSAVYNETTGQTGDGFTFDQVRTVFKDFKERGYTTTFIEDMPPYGFFSTRGGFTRQPTDYYLRPTNMAIWPEVYETYTCYQDRIEHELYWEYLLDLWAHFARYENRPHFSFCHMSTLTHNYFNAPGYVDKPFYHFLEKLFASGYHEKSLIMVYSDHALRFGEALNTTSSVHETRLPFFYIYLPDSLTLGGLDARQLRDIVRSNAHRLTSHIDLHATMLHVLTGSVPTWEPFSRSLLAPIPLNRTCSTAGIPAQYCLCDSYEAIPVTEQVRQQSVTVVNYLNQLLTSHGNSCVPLLPDATYRAFDSHHSASGQTYRLLHFSTQPNNALFETILQLKEEDREITQIESVHRMTMYGDESACVSAHLDIVSYCLCWEQLKQ